MSIEAKFFPVGQGLTYALKVHENRILFDIRQRCNYEDLKRFFDNQKIDILVISHFDADHSNGIKKLLENGFEIGSLHIPYVGEDERYIMKVQHALGDADYDEFLRYINQLQIPVVEVSGKEEFEYDDIWRINIHNSEGNSTVVIDKIMKNLSEIGIKDREEALQRLLNGHEADIKKAYKSAVRNLNRTSMFMEHGPLNDDIVSKSKYDGYNFKLCKTVTDTNYKTHTLITGDCNLDVNRPNIEPYIDQLGYILVPHHSGVREWSDYVCKQTEKAIWIVTIKQVGTRPYGLIARDIDMNGDTLYICDNKNSFGYSFL